MVGRNISRSLAVCLSCVAAGRGASAAPPDWGSDSSEKPDEPLKHEPSASAEDLGYLISDLQTSPTPYPLWITFLMDSRYPYQALGFGCTAEYYATPLLRLEGTYSFGLPAITDKGRITLGSYAELLAGAAVLRVSRQTEIKLAVREPLSGRPAIVKATVPTYHALFVEIGAITGFIQPSRCTARCDSLYWSDRTWTTEDYQLVMAVGGLRYVYFFGARSERARLDRKVHVQFYLHLIGKPFNPPQYPALYDGNDLIESTPFGGRAGVELPPFCPDCSMRVGFSAGYNPLPKGPTFTFHFAF